MLEGGFTECTKHDSPSRHSILTLLVFRESTHSAKIPWGCFLGTTHRHCRLLLPASAFRPPVTKEALVSLHWHAGPSHASLTFTIISPSFLTPAGKPQVPSGWRVSRTNVSARRRLSDLRSFNLSEKRPRQVSHHDEQQARTLKSTYQLE